MVYAERVAATTRFWRSPPVTGPWSARRGPRSRQGACATAAPCARGLGESG